MKKNRRQLIGKGISPGYASGKAYVYIDMLKLDYSFRTVPKYGVREEFARIERAFGKVLCDLVELTKHVESQMGSDYANILRADKAILRSPVMLEEIRLELEKEHLNAEEIVKRVFLRHRDRFYAIEESHFRERGDDIGDLCKQVIRALLGAEHLLQTVPEASVIVAGRLLPSDTILLQKKFVSAIVVEHCGTTSHAAIFARGMGIPVVSQINDAVSVIKTGEELLVDGITGRVIVRPDKSQKAHFLDLSREYANVIEAAQKSCLEPAITPEGVRIHLLANVGNIEDINLALKGGAEGIGLYRLEQLYGGQKKLLSEDELFAKLRKNLDETGGRPVTIRLLDTGGDKQLPYLSYPNEKNPMLGRRGVRFLLNHRQLLVSQLKVLVRLSLEYPVRILVPVVTFIEEMKSVREALSEVAQQLERQEMPPLGAMIETPAAALCAAELAEFSDFFSIGSNDLTQYVLAADRDSNFIPHYYRDDHPAVLRLIDQVCRLAHGRDVGICGELAGNPKAIPLLIKMGIREFSVLPLRIPLVKEIIRRL